MEARVCLSDSLLVDDSSNATRFFPISFYELINTFDQKGVCVCACVRQSAR